MYDVVITNDGSSSIYSQQFNEHYHSIHGAKQEAEHVFINAGLNEKMPSQNSIAILEIGFGTGLNTLLTAKESVEKKQFINYTSIELYPLENVIFYQLNFNSIDNKLYRNIYEAKWNTTVSIHTYFQLKKILMDIEAVTFENQFDIIYFDAFSPEKQPNLWTDFIFDKMFKALKKDGLLVTYCAKGIVKRTLKSVGFFVEALPGPKGKREMIRANKK